MLRKMLFWIIVFSLFLFVSCQFHVSEEKNNILYIIHAGSLTLPVHELSLAFREENPDVRILTEAWGSKAGARRVIDINTPADVFMSADYMVIENMLIPDHASWYLPFATNELSIVYTTRSRYASEINQDNWMDILMRPNVKYGRSNPDMDPCGVRSVFTIKLAEKKYGNEGFAGQLLEKDTDNIRPKETDLIALLEKNHIDYIFLYKSVAVQHGLEYLELPDSLSLGNFALNDWYSSVSIETLGSRPGETITEFGEAMVYGLTIPHKSESQKLAEKFVNFVLHPDKGQAILKRLGQDPVTDFRNPHKNNLPDNIIHHHSGYKPE
ncbi:MAG: extracellular solute-binding protein [Bacteroidetes bacterium]|nr:MAG: extracellular solute-binding protein [Bacteroidota bacterium]